MQEEVFNPLNRVCGFERRLDISQLFTFSLERAYLKNKHCTALPYSLMDRYGLNLLYLVCNFRKIG